MFWKWHDFVKEARDGFSIWFLKKNLKKSKWKESKGTLPSDPALCQLFLEKINRLLETGYLETGFVRWDVHFFSVPKGESNIRLVFNGTSNSLNNAVWALSFFLPISETLARLIDVFTYQVDLDG